MPSYNAVIGRPESKGGRWGTGGRNRLLVGRSRKRIRAVAAPNRCSDNC